MIIRIFLWILGVIYLLCCGFFGTILIMNSFAALCSVAILVETIHMFFYTRFSRLQKTLIPSVIIIGNCFLLALVALILGLVFHYVPGLEAIVNRMLEKTKSGGVLGDVLLFAMANILFNLISFIIYRRAVKSISPKKMSILLTFFAAVLLIAYLGLEALRYF